jgi:SAM-dependent methyltransferase
VFVPPEYHISAREEKERYDLHQNDNEDQGYRDFLKKIVKPVKTFLASGCRGLDFGSGPSPVLARMFREEGFEMEIFDPFYSGNPDPLSGEYDFITASEVIEHLRDPFHELDCLFRLLKSGGILSIMTGMLPGEGEFGEWFYKNDKTHICFYSPAVFRWIAGRFGLKPEWSSGNVVILRKRN